MAAPLEELVSCWIAWGGIDAASPPIWPCLEAGFAARP